ncbi:Uncharacterised protein [uncultured archaeon]|nr:Uncharacterised protein [uncultured archaeon]
MYKFDSNYSFNGPHILTLSLSDEFVGNFTQSFNITNRMLTLGNSQAENGSTDISNASYYRPSSATVEQPMALIVAGTGALGALVLVLVLLRR